MTECVILFRNTQNNAVGFISEENGEIATFPDHEHARVYATEGGSPVLRAFPYQIVELDDL